MSLFSTNQMTEMLQILWRKSDVEQISTIKQWVQNEKVTSETANNLYEWVAVGSPLDYSSDSGYLNLSVQRILGGTGSRDHQYSTNAERSQALAEKNVAILDRTYGLSTNEKMDYLIHAKANLKPTEIINSTTQISDTTRDIANDLIRIYGKTFRDDGPPDTGASGGGFGGLLLIGALAIGGIFLIGALK